MAEAQAPPAEYSAVQLAEMLSGILHSTDNNERRGIEAAVVKSLGTPSNLVQLVNVLCGNMGPGVVADASAGVRQLAAVLVRKKIFSLWHSLSQPQQHELRGLLLAQLGNEPARMVRFAIAHIVTRLVKADVLQEGEGWPELQQAVCGAIADSRPEMRELSMVLVYSIAEVFSETNSMSGLAAESVIKGLGDSDPVVLKAAVKAAAMLTPSLEGERGVYEPFLRQLVPQCLALLAAHAANKGSPASAPLCVDVLDLIEQLLDELSAKKHAELLVGMVQQLLAVLGNRDAHARVRQNCGSTLVALTSAKPKFIVARGLLQPMVDVCLHLMAEDATISLPDDVIAGEGDDDDDGDDKDEAGHDDADDDDEAMLHVQPSCMVGAYLLSTLATAVPTKAFTPALLPFISAVTEGKSMPGVAVQDPLVRKSAMLALVCLSEGSASYVRRRVAFVLDVVRAYLHDGDAVVRESAAFSLSHFCLRLQPEILSHHAELFPWLVPLLKDPHDRVRCRAADALDTLCENVAEELEPYIPTLLQAVTEALATSSLPTQKALCGVISSMAMTHCPSIVASGPAVLELLQQPFAVPATPLTIPLRAQATETVGIIGAAIGKEAFAPYLPAFMHHVVVENLAMGSAALREQSFGFLANVCEVLREEFLPFLDDSVAAALHTIAEDNAVYTNKHLLAGAEVPLALQDDMLAQPQQQQGGSGEGGCSHHHHHHDDNDDDDDEGDDVAEVHMRVRTADVEEKCSAVNCLGVFAETLLGQFGAARAQHCSEALSVLSEHFYPNIRSNMMVASAKLVKAAHGLPEVDKSPTTDTLAQVPRDMLDDLIHQVLLNTIHDETKKEVVAAACEAMQILLDFFGPQCFPFGPDAAVRECILFLRQKKACQLAVDFDAEDSDQDDVDGEDELFREADLRIAADHNASWRDVVTPDMVLQGVHLADDHDEEVMDDAMTMLESLAKAYGAGFAPYAPYVLPLLLRYCDPAHRDADDLVMASGTLTVVVEALGDAEAAPYFDAAVAAAFGILQNAEDSSARANSCYLLRVLVENFPGRFAGDAAALQQTLQALFAVAAAAEIPEAVDNAVSATCSLVRCCTFAGATAEATALLALLPSVVQPLLGALPMRIDKAENKNAILTLVFLLADPRMAPVTAAAAWLPDLARCVGNVLAARTVDGGEKAVLVRQGVSVFVADAQAAAAWGAARQAAQLTAEQQAAFGQAGL